MIKIVSFCFRLLCFVFLISQFCYGQEKSATQKIDPLRNLKSIVLGFGNYDATYKNFPPVAITDKDGKPLLSWRVALLPFLEEESLYKKFKLDETWDSPHNIKLAAKMPKVFFHPAKNKSGDNKTHYQVFYGNGAAFEMNKGYSMEQISNRDGLSNTLSVVEAEAPVLWTKPEDLPFDPKKNLPRLLTINGKINVAFCDGSARSLSASIKPETLKLLIQMDDGKAIPPLD